LRALQEQISTQRSNAVGCSQRGAAASQFRFANDPKTVDGVLKKLPRGTKIGAAAKYDGPECIKPVSDDQTRRAGQLSLL
jgi:hypothetical protein